MAALMNEFPILFIIILLNAIQIYHLDVIFMEDLLKILLAIPR